MPASAATSAASSDTNITSSPSLISKYNLEGRLADIVEEVSKPAIKGKEPVGRIDPTTWAAHAPDREAGLRERKAQMVLAARRRMLEKTTD